MSFVFNSEFDRSRAATDFELWFEQLHLEAMIPGEHKEVYIQQPVFKHNKNALFEHDHGIG